MTSRDPQTCRRALREIGEIAAVAILPDGQITDQEALRNIAAIAMWVIEEAPAARPDCGEVIRQLHGMLDQVDVERLSDEEAIELFSEVIGTLETSHADAFSGPA